MSIFQPTRLLDMFVVDKGKKKVVDAKCNLLTRVNPVWIGSTRGEKRSACLVSSIIARQPILQVATLIFDIADKPVEIITNLVGN